MNTHKNARLTYLRHFGTRKPLPAKAFDRNGLVMRCSSFSKCPAPGHRVGWVAAGRFAQRIDRLKLMTTLSVAVPSQEGLSEYLERAGYDKHLRQLRLALSWQQYIALKAVAHYLPEGTRVTRSEGGNFLWLQLPANVDALRLHRLAQSHRISVAPGHLSSADHRRTNCIRRNCGHPDDR